MIRIASRAPAQATRWSRRFPVPRIALYLPGTERGYTLAVDRDRIAPGPRSGSDGREVSLQHLAEADVERAQVPAVIAGGHLDNALLGLRRGTQAGGRGALDGLQVQAVDHDLVGAARLGRHLGPDHAPQGGRERGIGAGAQALVLAADLGARPGDPAGKR